MHTMQDHKQWQWLRNTMVRMQPKLPQYTVLTIISAIMRVRVLLGRKN